MFSASPNVGGQQVVTDGICLGELGCLSAKERRMRTLVIAVVVLVGMVATLAVRESAASIAIPDAFQVGLETKHAPGNLEPTESLTSTAAYTAFVPIVLRTLSLCSPGATMPDPTGDVSIAHIDVVSLKSTVARLAGPVDFQPYRRALGCDGVRVGGWD